MIIAISILGLIMSMIELPKENIQIIPGEGVGQYKLKTKRSDLIPTHGAKKEVDAEGLMFNFDKHDRLEEIIVLGEEYQTSKNIHIGSDEKEVVTKYGAMKKEKIQMSKGESKYGQIGDYAYQYPGMTIIVCNKKVCAFVIYPVVRKK